MTRIVRTSVVLVWCTLMGTSLAFAQAPRTWVSGVGDDANPCSRTAPCKTFAGAISKTAPGGEISVLDPGGFGGLTITKSLTIDGQGVVASIANNGGVNAIVINAAVTDKVVIRNITLNGMGSGLNGIRFIGGASLLVDNVTIQGNTADGIVVQPAAGHPGNVTVQDSVFTGINGVALHSKGTSSITVENSLFTNNNTAILADDTSTIRMSNNSFVNNLTAFGCNTGTPGGGTGTLASAGNNRKANNTGGSIPACSPGAVVTVQ